MPLQRNGRIWCPINNLDAIIKKALDGDVRSIARLITEVENETSSSEKIMKKIYPYTGNTHIIGVTGSPGSGKSTLVDKMIRAYRDQGMSVGVIAVDPSSPFSGGAVLADRIRMQQHTNDSGVFIRSMGSRGSLGGLSKSTYEGALVLGACDKDVVIIETVGVGQSEIDIMKIADTVCLVLVPGMGDDMQIMKAGIMEIADVFVINKADREAANKVEAEVKLMLKMFHSAEGWLQPVQKTIAADGTGVEALVHCIREHTEYLDSSDEGTVRLTNRLQWEVEEIIRRGIAREAEEVWGQKRNERILDILKDRKTNPYEIASKILDQILV